MALDSDTIRSLIVRYFDAFGVTKDADEIARCFAPDGDMMGVDGTFVSGRDKIRDHYRVELAESYDGIRTGEPELTSVRDLGSLTFADARWELFGPESDQPIATPAGCFLMGLDKEGSPVILSARVMIPMSLG